MRAGSLAGRLGPAGSHCLGTVATSPPPPRSLPAQLGVHASVPGEKSQNNPYFSLTLKDSLQTLEAAHRMEFIPITYFQRTEHAAHEFHKTLQNSYYV